MANPKNVFKTAKVKVQNSSPFDMSHRNLSTVKIGTLTPVLTEAIMPGDKIKLSQKFRAQLPPMASNFLGQVKIRMNAFFVPNRLLVGGWKEYMLYSQGLATGFIPEGMPKYYVPTITVPGSSAGAGSLADYLGARVASSVSSSIFESLPFLAYHKIWDDWYRQPNVQKSAFLHSTRGVSSSFGVTFPAEVPTTCFTSSCSISGTGNMNDGVNVLSLRQVNYPKDYFTNAYLNANGGASPMKVSLSGLARLQSSSSDGSRATAGGTVGFDSNARLQNFVQGTSTSYTYWLVESGGNAPLSFTIPQLRAANSLQRFAEDNAIAGGRYPDTILANYGVRPADALCDRVIYLGGFSSEVYNNSVAATSNGSTTVANNFTNRVGGTGAVSMAFGDDSIVDNFEATEHGIFMVLCDVVPYSNYSSGVRRQMVSPVVDGLDFVDRFCVPKLSNMGNQPIYQCEISDSVASSASNNPIFGYSDKYAQFKWHDDEVHGLLRSGSSLSYMASQRRVTGPTQIGSNFLTVPTSALDNVTAVNADLSNFGVVLDLFNQFRMVRPLPVYSIPTLCDDVDSHSVSVERNGTRL